LTGTPLTCVAALQRHGALESARGQAPRQRILREIQTPIGFKRLCRPMETLRCLPVGHRPLPRKNGQRTMSCRYRTTADVQQGAVPWRGTGVPGGAAVDDGYRCAQPILRGFGCAPAA